MGHPEDERERGLPLGDITGWANVADFEVNVYNRFAFYLLVCIS